MHLQKKIKTKIMKCDFLYDFLYDFFFDFLYDLRKKFCGTRFAITYVQADFHHPHDAVNQGLDPTYARIMKLVYKEFPV